jgi:hypothetical protein
MELTMTDERLLWHRPQILGLVIGSDTGFTKDGSCEDLEEPTGFERLKDGSCPIPPP